MNQKKRFSFLFASGMLIVGSAIYLCFRTTDLYMFRIFPGGRLPSWLIGIREWIGVACIPEWVKFNLPDAVWLLSYLLFMDILWGERTGLWKLCFLIALPLGTLTAELLQMCHFVSGTGDWLDILFYIIAIIIFINYKHLQL